MEEPLFFCYFFFFAQSFKYHVPMIISTLNIIGGGGFQVYCAVISIIGVPVNTVWNSMDLSTTQQSN